MQWNIEDKLEKLLQEKKNIEEEIKLLNSELQNVILWKWSSFIYFIAVWLFTQLITMVFIYFLHAVK